MGETDHSPEGVRKHGWGQGCHLGLYCTGRALLCLGHPVYLLASVHVQESSAQKSQKQHSQ